MSISKKPRYQTKQKRSKKREELRDDIRNWIIITTFYVLLAGIIYGTSEIYYPDPISLGFFGLYIDLATVVIFSFLGVWSITTAYIFRN